MGVVNLVLLTCVLRATNKKGRQLFQGRKVHPRENPGYAYGSPCGSNSHISAARPVCNVIQRRYHGSVGRSVLRDRGGGLTTRSWCRVGRHKSAREWTREGKTSRIVRIRRGDEFL